jgi:hypothetical protein
MKSADEKQFLLKVVNDDKQGGPESWQMISVLDYGDRCPFLFLFGRHFGLILFTFPLTPAQ